MMIRTAKRFVRHTVIAAGLLAAAAPTVFAQEAAMAKRATELREEPATSGRTLASLPAQAPLARLGDRQGPWVRVRTEAGATGWVHLFDVGPPTGSIANSAGSAGNLASGALRGVTGLFNTSRSPSAYAPTTTVGIRGLSAEDLARAQPNPTAVGQMEALRQSESDARAFAGAAALSPVSVDPLPAPARPAGGADTSNPQAQ